MGLLTDQEKERDYNEILDFLTSVKMHARMIRQEDGFDGDGIYVWEPGTDEEDPDGLGAFIYLMQLDEGEEEQICKGAVIYLQLPWDFQGYPADALYRICAVLNGHVGLGCFIPSETDGRVIVQYRYLHMMQQGEPVNAGVIAEILLDMFSYINYAEQTLTLLGEEDEE